MASKCKIIYFLEDSSPTSKEEDEAAKLNAHVVFRNSRYVPEDGCLEICNGVAGVVPKRYKEAYPDAKKAISEFEKARKLELEDPAPHIIAPFVPDPTIDAPKQETAQESTEGKTDVIDVPAPGATPVVNGWKAN